MTTFIYILIAIAVAYSPLVLFDLWSKRSRLATFNALAESHGFTYLAKDDKGLISRLQEFPLMQRGKDGRGVNLITNHENIWLFEYVYRVRKRARHNRRYQSAAYFQRTGQLWPEFKLAPIGLIAAVRTDFGRRGSEIIETIEMPEFPEFTRLYTLTGPHPDLIRPLFTKEVVASFMESPGASLEANGDKLLFYLDQKRLEPQEIDAFYQESLQRVELFVVDNLGG